MLALVVDVEHCVSGKYIILMLGISCYGKCECIRILYVLLQSIVGWSLIVNVEYYINGKYTMLWLKLIY